MTLLNHSFGTRADFNRMDGFNAAGELPFGGERGKFSVNRTNGDCRRGGGGQGVTGQAAG